MLIQRKYNGAARIDSSQKSSGTVALVVSKEVKKRNICNHLETSRTWEIQLKKGPK